MPASSSPTASCVSALKLQRERSATYQKWTSLFHRALLGDITPSELQRNIQGILLPEFQRISLALRDLQSRQSEAGSTTLSQWIDQLQDLEREHYGVTLSLANHLVDHCSPNVRSAAAAVATDATAVDATQPMATTTSSAEVNAVELKSIFKPADSDDDDDAALRSGEVEWREAKSSTKPPAAQQQQQPPAAAAETKGEASATLCVHDVDRCALQRLIPPRYHTSLFFVDCRAGFDELAGVADAPFSADRDGRDSEGEEELMPLFAKGHNGGDTAGNDSPVAFYNPVTVAQRCVAWSHTVRPIVRRQETLRSAIEDLCEELQGVISDV